MCVVHKGMSCRLIFSPTESEFTQIQTFADFGFKLFANHVPLLLTTRPR